MEKLPTIKKDELLFSGELEDDRVNTSLKLDDYDWMSYKLDTRFRTEALGTLNVEFEYFGSNTSRMVVSQTKDKNTHTYIYNYPTDIFQKYITEFLTKHLAAWDSRYAFNGGDIVLAFYNEVIEKGTLAD